jgi:hypothetical protein
MQNSSKLHICFSLYLFFICTSAYLHLTLSGYKFHLVLECSLTTCTCIFTHCSNRQFSLTPALSENCRGNMICVKFKFMRANWCACYEPCSTERFCCAVKNFWKPQKAVPFCLQLDGDSSLHGILLVYCSKLLCLLYLILFFSNTQENCVSLH